MPESLRWGMVRQGKVEVGHKFSLHGVLAAAGYWVIPALRGHSMFTAVGRSRGGQH